MSPMQKRGDRQIHQVRSTCHHDLRLTHRAAGHEARACGKHGLTPGVHSPRYPVFRQVRTVDKIESAPLRLALCAHCCGLSWPIRHLAKPSLRSGLALAGQKAMRPLPTACRGFAGRSRGGSPGRCAATPYPGKGYGLNHRTTR